MQCSSEKDKNDEIFLSVYYYEKYSKSNILNLLNSERFSKSKKYNYGTRWREGACANSGRSRLKCAYSGPPYISPSDPRGTGRSLLVSARASVIPTHLRHPPIYMCQSNTDDFRRIVSVRAMMLVCDRVTIRLHIVILL